MKTWGWAPAVKGNMIKKVKIDAQNFTSLKYKERGPMSIVHYPIKS
jgi:hypothetical protein